MDLGLTGKAALVTGASRGIGRAIALELAREGCDVAVAARTKEDLDTLCGEVTALGRRCVEFATDLREPLAAMGFVEAARAAFGKIDILVNNAGAAKRGEFFSLTDADFADGFALKFHGYVRLTRAAWPALRTAGGSVVNIIGSGGRNASAEFTIGGAVNAALLNFTKAMAQQGIRDRVRVNAVNPGLIETERLRARMLTQARERGISEQEVRVQILNQIGLPRFGQCAEVARMVCFLAGGAAPYMQGALVDMDGGLGRSI